MSVPTPNFPSSEQLDLALQQLRHKLDLHVEHEQRLTSLCHSWQQRWSGQVDVLQKRLAKLEAYLSAWMTDPVPASHLALAEVSEVELQPVP